jgi:hypothetical protein
MVSELAQKEKCHVHNRSHVAVRACRAHHQRGGPGMVHPAAALSSPGTSRENVAAASIPVATVTGESGDAFIPVPSPPPALLTATGCRSLARLRWGADEMRQIAQRFAQAVLVPPVLEQQLARLQPGDPVTPRERGHLFFVGHWCWHGYSPNRSRRASALRQAWFPRRDRSPPHAMSSARERNRASRIARGREGARSTEKRS